MRFRDHDGLLRRVEASGLTRKLAEHRLKEKLAQRIDHTAGSGDLTPDSRFTHLVEVWLVDLDLEGKIAPSTRALYERNMEKLVIPAFANYSLREITVRKVDQFIKTLASTKSYSTAKQAKTVLSLAFGLAVRYDALRENPVRETARLRKPPSQAMALTIEQVNAIRTAVRGWRRGSGVPGPPPGGQLEQIIEIMLGTSARIGEVLAIRKVVGNLLSNDALRTEADIQSDIKALLVSEAMNLEPDQVVRLEEQTKDGTRRRLDIAVGHAVVEVKKSLNGPAALADAVEQLAGYLRARITIFKRRYVGILTDGHSWILYDLIDDRMVEISRIELTATSPDRLFEWLEAILFTESGVKPVPDEIRSRLGADSPAYLLDSKELAALYEAGKDNPEVSLKRELWAKLLRTAFGSAFSDDASTFIDHTLLVITAETIAHAVMASM